MRYRVLSLLLVLGTATAPATSIAQVTVNPGALNQLNNGSTSQKTESHHPAPHHPEPRHETESRQHPPPHETHPAPSHAPTSRNNPPPAAAKPKPPAVPPTPPPDAVLKPLEPPPPAHPTTPPPPPPVVADAPGTVTTPPQGLIVTFGAGRSDLNATTDQAVQDLARKLPTAVFNLTAFAPGNPDDPSTPRRLSLSRALAVRSVLINAGVPSTRIYAHAMGPASGDGPPDRVDIAVTVPTAPPTPPMPAAPAPDPGPPAAPAK